MIPSPRVNHLAVGPGLPPCASGGSAPRPGALGLHFEFGHAKASLAAGLLSVRSGLPQIMVAWETHQPFAATAFPGKSWHGPQAAPALPW